MKKITVMISITALTVAMLLIFVSPSLANKPNGPSASNGLSKGKSDVRHLELYEKDSDWAPVAGGARGRLTFDSDSFTFNGHGLESGTEYSLIVYVDPWPNSGGSVLVSGTSNDEGNIHLSGGAISGDDLKIWLVLSDDVAADGTMTGWNASEYLFEYDVISN